MRQKCLITETAILSSWITVVDKKETFCTVGTSYYAEKEFLT